MDLGEQLAHDCAVSQMALAPDEGMKTFLAGQAKQEARHAVAFQWAIRWLSTRTRQAPLISKHMNQYRQLLMAAIERQDFAESLLAEQIILEGLGEAILQRLETGLANRNAPCRDYAGFSSIKRRPTTPLAFVLWNGWRLTWCALST